MHFLKKLAILFFVLGLLPGCRHETEPEYDETADYSDLSEDLCYTRLLNTLAREDNGIYIPQIGTVLEAGKPDEVWLLADNAEDALKRFRELIIPSGAEGFVEEKGNEVVLTIKDANISFSPTTNNPGAIAKVDIQIPEIPNLHKVFYTTEDLWPVNGTSSPFELGNIWKKDGAYWICIKDSRKGKGILLSFTEEEWVDGKNTILRYDKYDHFQKVISVRTTCASKETWMAFMDMRDRYPERLETNYREFEKLTWGTDDYLYAYDFERYVLRMFLRKICDPDYAWDDDDMFQIGSATVDYKYAWVPPYHYYIVDFDYYQGGPSSDFISHYKTEKKTDRPPIMMYSRELFFDSSFGNPEDLGWKCITRH